MNGSSVHCSPDLNLSKWHAAVFMVGGICNFHKFIIIIINMIVMKTVVSPKH